MNDTGELTLTVTRPAHGGDSIANLEDGRIVFVTGALPGDTVTAKITQDSGRFLRADVVDVIKGSPWRVPQSCPAAVAGAGCCDLGFLSAEGEKWLKTEVLVDQLRRIGKIQVAAEEIDYVPLQPHTGWRTRMRFGVDATGQAGIRKRQSHALVTGIECTQAVPGLMAGLDKYRFTPGAEVIVAMDTEGERHTVEETGRGRNRRHKVHKGSGTATQQVGSTTFTLPATGFWQAHQAAPEAYQEQVRAWLSGHVSEGMTVWDLYGGVGLLAAPLADLVGDSGRVESVELDSKSAKYGAQSLSGKPVTFRTGRVENMLNVLARNPQGSVDAIVLDPPRKGAGAKVIVKIAEANPTHVVHVGCDPATLARDLAAWTQAGYYPQQWTLFNAFPGTHHMETFVLLRRQRPMMES